jgi:hypothetical protein
MAFDLSTARPVDAPAQNTGFDLSTAKPVDEGFTGAGIIEPALAIGSSLASTAVGGLIGAAVAPFTEQGTGAELSQELIERGTFEPKTEEGQRNLQIVADLAQKGIDLARIPISGLAGIIQLVEGQGLDRAVETIQSVQEKGLGATRGQQIIEEGGDPLTATIAHVLPEAAEAVGGALFGKTAVKGTKQAADTLPSVVEPVAEATKAVFKVQTPTKQRIAKMIEEGSTDVETAKFKLDAPDTPEGLPPPKPSTLPQRLQKALNVGGPRVKKDKVAIETIRQGFDEGVIAAVKGSTPTDKAKMAQMVDLMEKGQKNSRFAMTNRPSDVAGDSLLNRFRVVNTTNRQAGKELDRVANSLKGKDVDFGNAVSEFTNDLDSIGVSLVRNKEGKVVPDFKGSVIEDLAAPEAAVKRIVARLGKNGQLDAFDIHRLKKFIDEQVSFGKSAEGLTGRTEGILKNLRRNLDDALDSNFAEYNKVNSTYSETRTAIDALQDVAGKKLDLTGKNADKATGTLLRGLMSNNKSRVNLMDAVEELDSVARKFSPSAKGKDVVKFGTKNIVLDDDILTQMLFADELDAVFGPVARTSFQGQIDQAVRQGLGAATSKAGAADVAIGAAGKVAEKVKGVNTEAAIKSIKELLKE